MVGYTIYLSRHDAATNPNACFEIGPLENNGIGNQSIPRQIVDSFISKKKRCFVLEGDLCWRFVPGFKFQAINATSSHTYTVASMGSHVSPQETNITTVIPIEEKTLEEKYDAIVYETPSIYTSLQLTGNGVSTYNQTTTWGNALLNNIIRIMEHFARDLPPAAPLEGQMWFNTTDKQLYVFVGDKLSIHSSSGNMIVVNGQLAAEVGDKLITYDNKDVCLDSKALTITDIQTQDDLTRFKIFEANNSIYTGKVYNLNQWKPIQKIDIDTSNFASRQYVDDSISSLSVAKDIDQLVEAIAAINNQVATTPSPLSIEDIKKQILTPTPYDISLFVHELTETSNNVASSILISRPVKISANDAHAVRILSPTPSQVSMELIKLTAEHESAIGVITIGINTLEGNVNLYHDVILQRGDLLVLRPLEVDTSARNIFITLSGSLLS